jgi:hypothetical protein
MANTQKTSTGETQGNGQVPTINDARATPANATRDEEKTNSDARKPTIIPDPRGLMSISLGNTPGSPRIQLRRSHKYKHYGEDSIMLTRTKLAL